jgi:diguanylate cyclase (GGDEF)-like protein
VSSTRILVLVVLMSAVVYLVVGIVVWRMRPLDLGGRSWAGSAAALAASLLLLGMRGWIPLAPSVLGGNILFVASLLLAYDGTRRLLRLPPLRWWTGAWCGLLVATTVVFAGLLALGAGFLARVVALTVASVPVLVALAVVNVRVRRPTLTWVYRATGVLWSAGVVLYLVRPWTVEDVEVSGDAADIAVAVAMPLVFDAVMCAWLVFVLAMAASSELQNRLRVSHEQLAAANEQLASAATTDALTGLRNRRYLTDALAGELRRADRTGDPVSLLILDVDGFKEINDTEGHPAGDSVLVAVGEVLRSRLRVTDTVGRWGGDEFLAVMPGSPGEQATVVAETIRAGVGQSRIAGAHAVSVSVGVAEREHGEPARSLIARADAALYEAKRLGRDRVVSAEPAHSGS